MSTWRILLLSLAFLGIVGLAMWAAVAYHPVDDKKESNSYKRLSGTVAEGFVYRVGREKHPRVTCSACRVGKLKLGLVSLGAFNTIEFDDLVVNVPDTAWCSVEDNHPKKSKGKSDVDMIVDTFNLRSGMDRASAETKKFAGIKISKFKINKMSGNDLVPIIHAKSLKNSGKRILLHNAVLYKEGQVYKLKEVELKVKPRFKLVWPTGSWDLTDIITPIH